MKLNQESATEEVRIELIPLIDVIFCILTFFLLAALQLTRQQAINVDLPKASTGKPQSQDMLLVSVNEVGKTFIEQQAVNAVELEKFVRRYHQVNPRGVVVLYAPKEARYNDVVQVLDLLREVGGDRVALATLPGAPQTGPGATNNTDTDNTDSSVTPSESESKQQPTPARTVNPNEFQLPTAPESSTD
ncbi:MAG: biopolymer transporter ExbD [Okeania sp. SIO2C2]|uniref:ExbD/TolR family protein n=1 Tax=Okeania sp. SIO2C2 TaxID=2607787 RepID=UPI0013B94D83|nr:biopolymer transporter ExbD [Okeania sp. SIO2C2]NEP87419.1 biopolymer transporter ExbD [Okeania sp. SIO2C2]